MSAELADQKKVPTISVVVPVYNEREVLPEFHVRLTKVLVDIGQSFEVVYINDGSTDGSSEVLLKFCEEAAEVKYIELSRNFGKECALTAGLDYSAGEAVVIIDADLQDPPELIPRLIEKWRDGYDNVYATRRKRNGETWLKRTTASLFYRSISAISKTQIPPDTGDFRLLSRRAVDSLLLLREEHRFMKGLFAWIGFDSTAIEYDRDPRYAGQSKFNYLKLWNFAVEGFTSFSTAPLKVSSYFGMLIAVMAGIYGACIIGSTLIFGNPVRGYSSLMCSILFLGGVQLVAVGILGEYIGRMFNQTKGRPLYLVKGVYGQAVERSGP